MRSARLLAIGALVTTCAGLFAACASLGGLRGGGDGGDASTGSDVRRVESGRSDVARRDSSSDAGVPCVADEPDLPLDASDSVRYATCGDATGVDLLTTAAHCGRCGHDCLGTSCDGGLCAPADVPVAGTTQILACVAGGDERLFVLDLPHGADDGFVHSLSLSGDAGPSLLSDAAMSGAGAQFSGMVVSADAIYTSFGTPGDTQTGWLYRQPLDGGALASRYLSAGHSPGGIALYHGTLAFMSQPTNLVSLWNVADGSIAEIASTNGDTQGGIASALDGGRVFWLEQAKAGWTLFVFGNGPVVLDVDSDFGQADSFVTDDQYLYVAESGSGRIVRVPVDAADAGSAKVFWSDSNLGGIATMAIDDTQVYWFAYPSFDTATLLRRAKCGGPTTVMLASEPMTDTSLVSSLVAAGPNLYWVGSGGGLRRIAK